MHPTANGIVASGQEPGVVGVETLHANPGAADSAIGAGANVVRWHVTISQCRIPLMRSLQFGGVDRRGGPANPTLGFETPYGDTLLGANQPEAGGHRSSIGEERGVANDEGLPVMSAHLDGEETLGGAAQQPRDLVEIALISSCHDAADTTPRAQRSTQEPAGPP